MNKMKFKLGATLLTLAVSLTTAFAAPANTSETEKAPAFSYKAIDSEKSYSPADFEGEYLLIDFWASWCPPCNAAAPELKRVYEEYSDKGFEILGVSIDGDKEAWQKKVKEKGFKWPNIMTDDKGKKVIGLYDFRSIPYFVLIDKKGNIIEKGFRINELEGLLKKRIK